MQRDEDGLIGDEEAEQDEREDELRPAEAPHAQGVAGDRAPERRDDDRRDRHREAVDEPDAMPPEFASGGVSESVKDVEAGCGRQRPDARRADLGERLQAARHDDVERHQEEQREDDEQAVEARPARTSRPDVPAWAGDGAHARLGPQLARGCTAR